MALGYHLQSLCIGTLSPLLRLYYFFVPLRSRACKNYSFGLRILGVNGPKKYIHAFQAQLMSWPFHNIKSPKETQSDIVSLPFLISLTFIGFLL